MVEPAELHRVFPPMQPHQPAQAAAQAHNGTDSLYTRLAVAEAELRLKDEIIVELRRSIALLTDQRLAPSLRGEAKVPPAEPLASQPATPNLADQKSATVADSPAPARRRRWWRFGR